MKKQVLGFNKEKIDEIDLSKALVAEDVKLGSIYYKLMNENSNIHIGTAFKKNRALVSGGGAKPWRQKGTGRARAGTRRSPIFKGGGLTFGNQRKNYKFKLPRKIKNLGVIALFNMKFKQDLITIIDDIQLKTPKVKEFKTLVKKVIDVKSRCIIISKDIDINLANAVRNMAEVKLLPIDRMIIRDLINDFPIYITKAAMQYLNEIDHKAKKVVNTKKETKKKEPVKSEEKKVEKAEPVKEAAKTETKAEPKKKGDK